MKRFLLIMLFLAAHRAGAQDFYNKGKAQLASRDTSGAVSSFQEAVKAGQKVALSDYYLGAIAFAQHKMDDAVTFLQASYKNDDENVDVIKLLAQAYYEKNDLKEALTYYRLGTKLAPKDCGMTVAFGQALVAADSTDAAIVQLTKASICMPDNPLIYLSLGDAYYKIGVKPLAITNYEKASELAPKDLDIRLKVARALAANKEYTEAIKAYVLAEQIDSTFPDPYLEHGRILVRAARSAAVKKTKQELYRAAIPPLGSFVKLSPKNVEGSVLYAESFFGVDQNVEATAAAKASLQLDSSNVDMWRIEAHAFAETKDFKDALDAFAALRRRNAIKPEDQITMGQAFFGAGMDAEALDAFQKALALDSTDCDIFFPLGALYMKRQEYSRASEMFEKKVQCDKGALSAYINAAITYMQPSNLNLARARELLFKSIDLKKDFLQGRLWLARYYLQVDSLDLAEDQYREVLKIIGTNIDSNKAVYGEAQRLMGSLYMSQAQKLTKDSPTLALQKYRQAIDAFGKARSVGADDANTNLSWGQAILQTLDPNATLGDPENAKKNQDALDHFATCVKKDPGNCQGHFWLGECYARSRVPGEDVVNAELKRKACEEWRTVLRLCPKNEDAKKALERLGCQ